MNWYLEVLKKYAVFNGRARRKEYWMFFLFNIIFGIAASLLDTLIGTAPVINSIYGLAILIPGIAVSVRRLHDTGRSGWFLLLGLIPFVGAIILLVFFATDGDTSDNEYGANPKLDNSAE
nr:DUF805 domain-containing protein [uncultured Marinifilum sp.]